MHVGVSPAGCSSGGSGEGGTCSQLLLLTGFDRVRSQLEAEGPVDQRLLDCWIARSALWPSPFSRPKQCTTFLPLTPCLWRCAVNSSGYPQMLSLHMALLFTQIPFTSDSHSGGWYRICIGGGDLGRHQAPIPTQGLQSHTDVDLLADLFLTISATGQSPNVTVLVFLSL